MKFRQLFLWLATLTLVACAPIQAGVTPAVSTATHAAVVQWINATAHPMTTDPTAPLDDLAPLRSMVGSAELVGLGEATHGSSEIWTIKQRMVEYLIEQLGFTSFVLEVDWPIGQQLDAYVLHGTGDLHTILSSFPWNSQEVVNVFAWLRAYNADPQHVHKVRVAGMDIGSEMALPTPAIFANVTTHVQTNAPDLLPQVQRAYTPLLAAPPDPAGYAALPQPTRDQYAAQAQQVVELLDEHEALLVEQSSRTAFATARQDARDRPVYPFTSVVRHKSQRSLHLPRPGDG